MKNFALTGAAGYIAPRHMKAICDTENCLVAAVDPHDSVGILDTYFPNCAFFTEYERFDRHLERLKRQPDAVRVQYVSICSPNYLHDAHVRTALRVGADALCEKPLVLKPWNLDALAELEQETGRRIWTILQLRAHPELVLLKKRLEGQISKKRHNVVLSYITSRGKWYRRSWKGIPEKSGGIAANIGVHLFDLLIWLFGPVEHVEKHTSSESTCSGILELANANVQWFLSIDAAHIPAERLGEERLTYRSISVDGDEIEFSDGFTDLHTEIYRLTLSGNGFGIQEARPAIELMHQIYSIESIGIQPYSHSFLRLQSLP